MKDETFPVLPRTAGTLIKPDPEPPRQVDDRSDAGEVFDYWLSKYRQQLDEVCQDSLDIPSKRAAH